MRYSVLTYGLVICLLTIGTQTDAGAAEQGKYAAKGAAIAKSMADKKADAVKGMKTAIKRKMELVKYTVKDDAIAKSLTGKAGNAAKGRKAAINRKKGNCLACHKLPVPEQQFHGNVGPDLAKVGERYSEGELRLRLVNSKAINEDTTMPGFYRIAGLHRVQKKWKGKTILSASEIEDIVAYLKTLR